MQICEVSPEHKEAWLFLRKQLWPEPDEIHLAEMQDILDARTAVAFLLFNPNKDPIGFIEGAIYLDSPQKYGYIEGWFVLPNYRGQGLGGRLLGALEEWFLHRAISLTLSDTIPEEYPLSPKAHARYGYKDLTTLQIFVKELGAEADTDRNPQAK